MKKLFIFLLFLISCFASAQTTTTTGTIQFPDGQAFVNGTVRADFTPLSGNISVFTYLLNGLPFPYNVSGTMNGSGTFLLTLTDDHKVNPTGGQWKFTVCSLSSLPCYSSVQDVFGPSIDLSGPINAAIINAVGNSFNYPRFYNDTEAALNLGQGIAYYNLNSNRIRFYNGTIWQDLSAGAGGLADPGSNGILKRTALNTTAIAAATDLIALWTGTCNASTFLRADGSCQTAAGSVAPIQKASIQSGATSDVQITNAIAALPSGNGIVWADYSTNQTWAACPTWGSGSIQLMLYSVQYSSSVNCTIPKNITVWYNNGALSCPATGTTLTILGYIQAPNVQIFCNIASGQGSLSFFGNRTMTMYSPVWFGVDCTNVADVGPVYNQILSFLGEDFTLVVPNDCTQNQATQINVSSRASFHLMSQDRVQNGGGNQHPSFNWTGTTGGMWNFIANQAPTVEGFAFSNGGSSHMDYVLQFDGNPAARIGTEAMVRFNTFTNNMVNPTIGGLGTFDAIKINTVSGQNHEKNVITDNDFFCSQSRTFTESSSTIITNGSPNVTCGLANCTYLTDANVGDRVRISYATATVGTAPGIQDTTILSITDNNHLVLNTNSTASATNARIQFRQAYGNAITIGSVNSKHNVIDRNSGTQCARVINMTNGSFSLSHLGGSANDVAVYINNTAEPTELDFIEDENTLRDVYINNPDGMVTMNHLRNSLGIAGEYDGFIYFNTSGRVILEGSVLQDTPATNQVVFGTQVPGNVQITSIGNTWAPGVATLSNLGYANWRTFAEGAATGVGIGFIISCGDYGIQDAPGGACFNFGDGGIPSSTTNEGALTVASSHFGNFPSFNTFTAEPNVQVNTFLNEARGYQVKFNAFNNSTSMTWIGFDVLSKINPVANMGSSIGFRYAIPTSTTAAQPFARGHYCAGPLGNTVVTTAQCFYAEDLSVHTGITNRYAFYGAGSTDISHFGGPTEIGGGFTFLTDAAFDIGNTGALRPRNIYYANQLISQVTTGTAPASVISTTPVTNLTTVPTTYNAAGTQQTNVHIVEGSGTLTSGTPSTSTITLAGSAVFTSNTTYNCTLTNKTTQANSLSISYTDGSHFVVTGPNTVTDGFSFNCVGN